MTNELIAALESLCAIADSPCTPEEADSRWQRARRLLTRANARGERRNSQYLAATGESVEFIVNGLSVRVVSVGEFLNLHPSGYGQPVTLDYSSERLRLLVNQHPDVDEPENIDLESAKE